MTFWLIIASMTVAALAAVLWPALRARGAEAGAAADDRAFYEAQLADIDRDRARGVLADADGARAEAARRLLRASGRGALFNDKGTARAAAIVLLVAAPALTLPIYVRYGAPAKPAMPHAERVQRAESATKVESREGLRDLFAQLEQDPRNPILLEFLVPRLMQSQRFDAAADALTIIVEEAGATPRRLTDLAAARANFAQSRGQQDPEVRKLLERALEMDGSYLLARFLLGQVKAADGEKDGALADLRAVEAALPANAPVRPTVAKLIRQIEEGPAAAPVPPGGDAIAALPEEDRNKAIRGMVEGLDQRLAGGGGKPEEWQRLVRAWSVLKETDKAKAAVARARVALAGQAEALAAIEAMAKELGVGK